MGTSITVHLSLMFSLDGIIFGGSGHQWMFLLQVDYSGRSVFGNVGGGSFFM